MADTKQVLYPGIRTTTDGAGAVVWVETHISEAACAYPITSSTPMGVGFQIEVSKGRKNLWGTPLKFIETESEHSSASAAEGFAAAGGRVVNFTSGQGLILMKEVLYVISGKRLPVVFHIGARALTSQSLNVHAGHDDVFGVEDTGWGIIFAKNVQEVADLAVIARRIAEDSQTPFLLVQDGFLTTHTIESAYLPEPELMKEFVGDPREKINNFVNPEEPLMIGVVQNQDSYMKGKIAQRYFYDNVAPFLKRAMNEYSKLTGRHYDFIETYRMEDAEYAVVTLGTMAETAMATVDWIRENKGWNVGVVNVRVLRPFPGNMIVNALKNVKAFAVIERLDEPLAQSNPLAREIKAAFVDAYNGERGYPEPYTRVDRIPKVYYGSAGLGGRDVRPGDFIAVFEHIMSDHPTRYFALNIKHPLALERKEDPDCLPEGAFTMRGHSVGGMGSVTTNKVIATIVGDLFNLYVQAYPKYGAEKKGLPTTYYLIAATEPIKTHSMLTSVDFVPINNFNAFHLGNPLQGVKRGGMVFISTEENDPVRVWANIPWNFRKTIVERDIKVLALDTAKIAREVAPSPDLEVRMQGIVLLGVFLRYVPFVRKQELTEEKIFEAAEKSVRKYFGKGGEEVVRANMEAIMRGYREVFEIPKSVMVGKPEEIPTGGTP